MNLFFNKKLLFVGFLILIFLLPSVRGDIATQTYSYDNFGFVGLLHDRDNWQSLYAPSYNSTIESNGTHCVITESKVLPIISVSSIATTIRYINVQCNTTNSGDSVIYLGMFALSPSTVLFGFYVNSSSVGFASWFGIGLYNRLWLRNITNYEVLNLTIYHFGSYLRFYINEIEYYWINNEGYDLSYYIGMFSDINELDQPLEVYIDSVEVDSYLYASPYSDMEQYLWLGISIVLLLLNIVIVTKAEDNKLLILLMLFLGLFNTINLFYMDILPLFPLIPLIYLFIVLAINLTKLWGN